jgi:hypothetical protein
MKRLFFSVICVLAVATSAGAWNATGHMIVASIAYQLLNPPTQARVDVLLKLNPEYPRWIAGIRQEDRGFVAFLNAGIWPDCIKGDSCPGYTSDGPNGGNTPPDDATATLNTGYSDHLMHKYWHFADLPYSPAGLPTQPSPKVNAITEIERMRAAIGSKASDGVKSYDIAWLIHLVGDIHQPLHAISRFTVRHPNGDAGGNLVRFCNAPCDPPDNLHAYWDNLMGNALDVASIQTLSTALLTESKPSGQKNTKVDAWAQDSAALAMKFAYAAPIDDERDPRVLLSPRPSASYEVNAHTIARQQVLLAAYRLANLLNRNLK